MLLLSFRGGAAPCNRPKWILLDRCEKYIEWGKGAFSVAEAMITLLIVSIMFAVSVPLFTQKIKNDSFASLNTQIPSGMVSFFNKPCSSVTGEWEDVPEEWKGRYPRIVGNYTICDKDGFNCTNSTIVYNEKYDDAIRNLYGEVNYYNSIGFLADNAEVTGVFKKVNSGSGNRVNGMTSTGNYPIIFDASNSVPVAAENRPKTVGLYMCVKI